MSSKEEIRKGLSDELGDLVYFRRMSTLKCKVHCDAVAGALMAYLDSMGVAIKVDDPLPQLGWSGPCVQAIRRYRDDLAIYGCTAWESLV
jgi:hypothetical protein